ncbi:uncharacterized protein LOC135691643 isoform X2 [Rhopilema esculentum]|uniref:uncharacterized protein LOC135691643 isoform X2 n=1 Tax=Rhopilema esculentum TaxID=499914 RepID=UPI0031D5D128
MEIILALIATRLAIIFGFLSIRAIFSGGSKTSANNFNICAVVKEGMAAESKTPIHKCVHPLEEKATNKVKEEPNSQNEQNSTQKKATQNSECFSHGDKSIDDASDLFINPHDLDLLSTSEGNAKPIKVKEFIRSLRENHMEDMTEEEIEQENRRVVHITITK